MKIINGFNFGLIVLLWFAAAFSADAIPLDKVRGPMCIVRDTVTGITLPMSPENSQYNVIITDGLAHIRLTQLFVNHFKNVNDIVYVFPLPHEGSVHAMSMNSPYPPWWQSGLMMLPG
jgi:hypothetical protein